MSLSRIEEILTGGEVKPQSRIEQILMGEDIVPQSRIEVLLKEKLGGGGGGGSKTVTITWDGDTSGKTVVADAYCKVSDNYFNNEDIVGANIALSTGQSLTVTQEMYDSMIEYGQLGEDFAFLGDNGEVVCVRKPNTDIFSFHFDEVGIYFNFADGIGYTSSFTYTTSGSSESGGGGLPIVMQKEFTLDTDATTTATVVATLPIDELVQFVSDLPVSYTPTSLHNTKMVYCEIKRIEDPDEITDSNAFYMMHCAALLYRSHNDRIAFGAWKPSSIQVNGVDARRYDGVYGLYWDSPQYNTGLSIKARSGSSSFFAKAGTYRLTILDMSGVVMK